MARITLTAKRLRKALDYNPATGAFTWRFRVDRRPQWNSRFAGKPTSYVNARGYGQIRIEGHLYLAHRLAWLHTYGTWPPEELDHINGNPSDNRVVNLRLATRNDNCRNTRIRSNNTSGFKGVSYVPHLSKWRATIRVHNVQQHIGVFKTPEAAHAAYLTAARAAFGEFANSGRGSLTP